MPDYCVLADVVDPALTIKQRHVDSGNIYVGVVLRERGIDPAEVTLPNTLLTEIAIVYAKREAAISGAIGENSTLIDKARQFEATLRLLIGGLTREALGIAVTDGAAFGNVTLGRA